MTTYPDFNHISVERKPPTLFKQTCALLVIDMQQYFRELAQPILRQLSQVIGCFREAGVPVDL